MNIQLHILTDAHNFLLILRRFYKRETLSKGKCHG